MTMEFAGARKMENRDLVAYFNVILFHFMLRYMF